MQRLQVLAVTLALAVAATAGGDRSAAQGGGAKPLPQRSPMHDIPGKKPVAPVREPVALHFQPGERLVYRIHWGPAEAATAQLGILPHHLIDGRNAWHFQAKASTIKTARLLYPLDDQFDSYSDVLALGSLQYEMYLREPGKNRDRVIRMNREGEPAPAAPSVRVPAGTRDPLGLLYALRAWDWAKTKEAIFPLYDGHKLYEVRAREVAAGRSIAVPSGTYTAARIELRIFEREKELTDARFWIWLASDTQRTPVLIEAELPFGKLRVELVSSRTE